MTTFEESFAHRHGTCAANCPVCAEQADFEFGRMLENLCCDAARYYAVEIGDVDDMRGRDHDGDCDNYDGAPDHQWEVTSGGGYEPDTRGEHDPTL